MPHLFNTRYNEIARKLNRLYRCYHGEYIGYDSNARLVFKPGCNDLTKAILLQDVPMIKRLINECIKKGIDINDRYYIANDPFFNEPVRLAADLIHFGVNYETTCEIVQLLVNAGLDPNGDCIHNTEKNNDSYKILKIAYKKQN